MASTIVARVHPVVLFAIADAHERRLTVKSKADNKTEVQTRAIGTLLGTYERGVINVTNCYAVPFAEIKTVDGESAAQLDKAYNSNMLDSMLRSTPNELPVGWFSTSATFSNFDTDFHDYFHGVVQDSNQSKETMPVLMLTLDALTAHDRLNIHAYLRTTGGIPDSKTPHTVIFHSIQVNIDTYRGENVALDMISHGLTDARREVRLTDGVTELRTCIEQIIEWIDKIRAYVDDVLANRRVPDPAVGRQLMEVLSVGGAHFTPKHLDTIVASSMRDHLMVTYLAQVAKTQLALYEKMVATV